MPTLSAFTASGTWACGMYIRGPRIAVEAAVAHVADDADDLPVGLAGELAHDARPMASRSFSGSPLGQNCRAIASLMMTTGGDVPVSRSLKARPRLIGI